jgi:membrane fusion protein (multidrug efflux system)
MKQGAISAADAAALESEVGGVSPARRRKAIRLTLLLSVPLLIAAIGLYMWLSSGRYVSTDNAYVQQDKVSVSAEITGTIAEVAVHENQQVKKGDLLFRIDPRPYRIALEQAEAQIAGARVQVSKLQAETLGTGEDVTASQANLEFAQRAFARQDELLKRGFTTRARYDEAQHAVQEARERLAASRANVQIKRSALASGPLAEQPAYAAAVAARDKALLDLQRTEVRAPIDGFVTQAERLQEGNAVVMGLPMVTIVRSGTSWVEANYKETQLTKMAPGQSADIHLDAYPSARIKGHVLSIGRGTGSEFSVLPAQNATGNWVKVTQRIPVRIAIDNNPGRPLLAGLSAKVTIDTQETPAPSGAALTAAPGRQLASRH